MVPVDPKVPEAEAVVGEQRVPVDPKVPEAEAVVAEQTGKVPILPTGYHGISKAMKERYVIYIYIQKIFLAAPLATSEHTYISQSGCLSNIVFWLWCSLICSPILNHVLYLVSTLCPLHFQFVSSLCPVYVQFVSSLCPVCVQFMSSLCPVYVQFMSSLCPVYLIACAYVHLLLVCANGYFPGQATILCRKLAHSQSIVC